MDKIKGEIKNKGIVKMKTPNINALLNMTKSFLHGKVSGFEYSLDFPYEYEQRHKKILRENQLLAELIYDCLIQGGVYRYDDLNEDEFMEVIAEEYYYIIDVRKGNVDII